MKNLAIVIPAFKPMYFEETLRSIERQTNQDFTLYIGDDGSPHNLGKIVDQFKGRMDIRYRHFDENLGSKDLVAHWERCIEMVGGEEWIWLFSDDDIMEPECVEEFYSARKIYPEFDLFHFNVVRIDQFGTKLEHTTDYADPLTIEKFVEGRLCNGLRSYVVEYIFKKSHFISEGGFEHFDLAWCSDDATWIKLASEKGIKTLPKSKVYWRKSPYNITPSYSDLGILRRKNMAMLEFSKWLLARVGENKLNLKPETVKNYLSTWLRNNYRATVSYLSFKDYRILVPLVNKTLNLSGKDKISIGYIFGYKTYRLGVERIKIFLKMAGLTSI